MVLFGHITISIWTSDVQSIHLFLLVIMCSLYLLPLCNLQKVFIFLKLLAYSPIAAGFR